MTNQQIHSGSHFKKILTKGVWYFFSSIFIKAINLVLLPIITRYIPPSELGILSTLESIGQLLPVFISLSLDEAYCRFYFNHNKTHEEQKTYISTYFWIILGWGIFVVFISMIIGKISIMRLLKVPFFPFISLIMIGPLFLQLSLLGGAYLRQELKSASFSFIESLLHIAYIAVFMYLLIAKKIGISSKVYGLFLSSLISVIIFSAIIIKNKLIGFKFNKNILIEGLKYSIPLLPNQMSAWITGLSDRIILILYKTTAETGIYSIGYQLGQTMRMISMSVFKVYTPIMYSMLIEKKEDGLKRVEAFFPNYFIIIFWIAFCIGFFSKEFILLLTESKYHTAYLVVPIVTFAYFFGAIYKPFLNIISYSNKTWIISSGAIFQAISNIIFNIIFIPIFGQLAAAWTTFGSFFIYFMWIFLWSQKIEKINIRWNKIIQTLLIGLFLIILYLFINSFFKDNFIKILLLKIGIILIALFITLKFRLIDLGYFKYNRKKFNNEK